MISLRRIKQACAVFPLLLAFSLPLSNPAHAYQFKVTKVYNGDTIRVEGCDAEINVRLAGIDAPELFADRKELGQPFGMEAREFLSNELLGKTVKVEGYGHKKHNLMWGVIYLDGEAINLRMLREGLAEAYRGENPEGLDMSSFYEAEKEAIEPGKGIWSQGEGYQSPLDWRKTAKAKAASAFILYGLCDQKGQ
jgi:micrococcal nuclease